MFKYGRVGLGYDLKTFKPFKWQDDEVTGFSIILELTVINKKTNKEILFITKDDKVPTACIKAIKPLNKSSYLLDKIKFMIDTCPDPMIIITKSVQLAQIIKEQNPQIGIWTGQKKENLDSDIWVATQQTMGVGVDGLQHKFKHITVLDPVSPDSGEYDDYRQLLWRITGSRQQHDVHLIELIFDNED